MTDTAVLLIDCLDQKGLVAKVSSLLYANGANILHADQHQDHALGLFFMRLEWSLHDQPGSDAFDLAGFEQQFKELAAKLSLRWQLQARRKKIRAALFCSQQLHCMVDLLHKWSSGELDCDISVIVSNHLEIRQLANFYCIPFEHVPVTASTRTEAEARQIAILERYGADLVVLARYMQILTKGFVDRYPMQIINVHHSFLPAFVGTRPYQAAHARGVKLIGATSHYVTVELDDGPIIEQDVERISHRDQVGDLIARGRDLERVVLARAVRWHIERRILCYENKTVVFD